MFSASDVLKRFNPACREMEGEFVKAVREADSVLVFTGAGASAESGIPTFRGSQSSWWSGALNWFVLGLFGTPFGWNMIPSIVWPIYRDNFFALIHASAPNDTHKFFQDLIDAGKHVLIITQNVDGMHQAAGTDPALVAELHGTVWNTECTSCGLPLWQGVPGDTRIGNESPDMCQREGCTGVPRPSATLFGEPLPEAEVAKARKFTNAVHGRKTLIVIVGTSLVVDSPLGFIKASIMQNPTPKIWIVDPDVDGVWQRIRASGIPDFIIANFYVRGAERCAGGFFKVCREIVAAAPDEAAK